MKILETDESTVLQSTERHYGAVPSRPGLEGFLIPGKRGKLLAACYTVAGPGPHPAVLICHGIPGVERNLDLAQFLRREGFHVMTFHYSGHSLGGYVCGRLAAKRSEIKAAVLLMPCDIGRTAQLKEEEPAAYQAMAELLEGASLWLSGTSGKALLMEAEANEEAFGLVPAAKKLARIPLLCVSGTLDTDTPENFNLAPLLSAIRAAGGTLAEHRSYPTDHCFSDYRLTVAEDICAFLKGVSKA